MLAQLFCTPAALACTRALVEPFRVDPTLTDESAEAPSSFRELRAISYRVSSTHCNRKTCTTNNCGDSGTLLLQFEPPDEASEGELGYRAIWIGPPLPAAFRERLDRVMPLDPATRSVAFEFGFDEIVSLEGEVALVAVDRAGRESIPSEPVRVSFSGCTEYFDQPYCVAGGPMPEPEDVHCSVASVRPHPPSPLAAAVGLSLCTLLAVRRVRLRALGRAQRARARPPRCR
jgi:hypothetical protein